MARDARHLASSAGSAGRTSMSAILSHNGSPSVANTMRSSRKRRSPLEPWRPRCFLHRMLQCSYLDGGNVNRHDFGPYQIQIGVKYGHPGHPLQKGSSRAHLHLQVGDEEGVTRLRRRSNGEQTPAEPVPGLLRGWSGLTTECRPQQRQQYDWKTFAGICPRQQRRASYQGPKKEDATRGRLSVR